MIKIYTAPMVSRPLAQIAITQALARSPIVAILGPRQCGKTTLARITAEATQTSGVAAVWFDCESVAVQRQLENAEFVLGSARGLVVIDEIQALPALFSVLRILADRPNQPAQFLILGSASPTILRAVAETLAGRVELIELSGFDLSEVGPASWRQRWLRGGFPRSFLAKNEPDSVAWREGFVRTFLERDIPQLGITIPASAMRRFWTMLAHYHGQVWNASELGRSMGLSDKTVRAYLDILTGTYVVRQLQPWHANIAKRQVKAPKIYIRDSGLTHRLLEVDDELRLLGHPKIGASWEGFALEEILSLIRPSQAYFWSVYSGAELDLFIFHEGRKIGFEFKFSEAPRLTPAMRTAMRDLELNELYIVYPGTATFDLAEGVTVLSVADLASLPNRLAT